MTRRGLAQHCQTLLPFKWPATLHVFKIWRNQEGKGGEKKTPKIERKEEKEKDDGSGFVCVVQLAVQ